MASIALYFGQCDASACLHDMMTIITTFISALRICRTIFIQRIKGGKGFLSRVSVYAEAVAHGLVSIVHSIAIQVFNLIRCTPEALATLRPLIFCIIIVVCVMSGFLAIAYVLCSLAAFLELSNEQYTTTVCFCCLGIEILILQIAMLQKEAGTLLLLLMAMVPITLSRSVLQALNTFGAMSPGSLRGRKKEDSRSRRRERPPS